MSEITYGWDGGAFTASFDNSGYTIAMLVNRTPDSSLVRFVIHPGPSCSTSDYSVFDGEIRTFGPFDPHLFGERVEIRMSSMLEVVLNGT